ncbi:MAG TPA: bifunctional glutamate N-acetyltransferase/amino-acid acetyltransferase ArgJ [Thermoanaerobaculia bacterium]|nr:bifunctional glutamate N-acetyltransferase/amino-acid acetyltransferase ArgJ [Thermoanaerobaculia bacterium]HXT50507.1 bifunctional glutamate N-acetyltransferase/amino-acid acetyltransferase ArgJ [Thermoanaerobaculia bacterium]
MSAARAGDPDETTKSIAEVASEPTVGGFRFAAAACGMRFVGRDDLGLIVADVPATWAGVYTTSSAPGAPVVVGRELLRKGKPLRAVLVNAGIANAGTGKAGVRDCRRVQALVAKALGVREREVVCSSTGRIGPRIDVGKVKDALPALVEGLASDRSLGVARAMMTSDSVPKRAVTRCTVDGHQVTLIGVTKGSGMIAPKMATTLSFLVTDAAVKRPFLQESLAEAVGASLNQLVIDGDTSTSDTCLLLASGAAGNRPLRSRHRDAPAFRAALAALTADLARQLARDGEAATKLLVVQVRGAKTAEQARAAARAIAGSNLMKTSIGGGRLDWGRVIAALGSSGAQYVHERFTLSYGDAVLVKKGKHQGKRAAAGALAHLGEREVRLVVDLGLGRGEAEAFGCDLTEGYVRENSAPLPT